jgi:hypothetical protein
VDPILIVAGVIVLAAGLAVAIGGPLAARGHQVRIADDARGTQSAVAWVVFGAATLSVALLIVAVR